MANWYVSSVAYAAVTQWAAASAVTVGMIRRQLATPTQGSERCFRCTTAGTTGATEPAWNLNLNGTTTDNTVVWTECTGQEAYQSAGNWTAPAATMDLIWGSRGAAAGGPHAADKVFIDSAHSETWSSSRTNFRQGANFVVTVAGSTLPPGAESLATGASITTTGATGCTFTGWGYFYGLTFNMGSGNNNGGFVLGGAGGSATILMENCFLNLPNTNTGSRIVLGSSVNFGRLILTNTPLGFGNASQGISYANLGSDFRWYNTPNGIQGTSPSNLIVTAGYVVAEINGVDLSGLTGNIVFTNGGTNVFSGIVRVTECKLNAATVLATNLRLAGPDQVLQMTLSDDTTGNNVARAVYGAMSATTGIKSDTTVYRSGGATAGSGNPFSLTCTADNTAGSGNPVYPNYPIFPQILFWNSDSGAPKTVTVHILANKAALPTNNMLGLSLQYLGSSASTGTSVSANIPLPLARASPTNLTQTTMNWSSGLTARANSTAYTLGQAFKVASNDGRVFFCTTAGSTAASEPAGYASAVDGDSVTDGTAVFRAGYRVSVSQTVTPGRVGWFAAFVHYLDAQATPTAVYVDPMAVVT